MLHGGVVGTEQHIDRQRQGWCELGVGPEYAFPFPHGPLEVPDVEPKLTEGVPLCDSGGVGLDHEGEVVHGSTDFTLSKMVLGPLRIPVRVERRSQDIVVEPGEGVRHVRGALPRRISTGVSGGGAPCHVGEGEQKGARCGAHQASACSTVSSTTSSLRAALMPASSSSMSSGLSSRRFFTASRP